MPKAIPGGRTYMRLRNSLEEMLADAQLTAGDMLVEISVQQNASRKDFTTLLTLLAHLMSELASARNVNSELIARYGQENDAEPSLAQRLEALAAEVQQLQRFHNGAVAER